MSRVIGYARALKILSVLGAVDDSRTGSDDDLARANQCYTADMDDRTSAKVSVTENIVQLPQYRPLGSVWYGEEDAELLEQLLRFYPRKRPRNILDATVNGGRFWRDSKRKVIGLDIDPKHRPTVVADNTAMPFGSETIDVVVYDPPHIPNQGRDRSKDFNKRGSASASGRPKSTAIHSHIHTRRSCVKLIACCVMKVSCSRRSLTTCTTIATSGPMSS
jgi:hypothetical protein